MRAFLRKHSAVYQKIVRPDEERIAELTSELGGCRLRIVALHVQLEAERQTHKQALADKAEAHGQALIAKANAFGLQSERFAAANVRMRRVNRDLVAKLRELGVPADEWPAEKCPFCGSLAAIPDDIGKHQTGIVRYGDRTVRLFCDGSEE